MIAGFGGIYTISPREEVAQNSCVGSLVFLHQFKFACLAVSNKSQEGEREGQREKKSRVQTEQ